MFAASITTVGRPLGIDQPNVQFIDTSTLCFGLENGVLLEDASTGHQVLLLSLFVCYTNYMLTLDGT